MSTPKNHDPVRYLPEDVRRLLTTAVIVVAAMGLLVFVESRYRLIGRFIVLPQAPSVAPALLEPQVELAPSAE